MSDSEALPGKPFGRRAATLISWFLAFACLRCTLDFDRFKPSAVSSPEGGGGNGISSTGTAGGGGSGISSTGTAGGEANDSSLPQGGAAGQLPDASTGPSDAEISPRDAKASDVPVEACTPQQSCLDDAKTCAGLCTTTYDACVVACNDRQPCKVTCEKDQGTCKRACTPPCQTCTKNAGCESAISCQMASQ